jgi:phage tail-like protein
VAVTPAEIKRAFPLPLYNFSVQIGNDLIACSEVTGLSIAYEVSTFKESQTANGLAGPRVFHMPGQAKEVNITLKKGIARGVSIKNFYRWIAGIATNQVEKKDIFVRLCDETGAPVISWRVINAFPTKLEPSGFDAKSNDVAVETMELRADGIAIEEV